ncbi:MAG TPA: FAD-binding oxidoreductase [Acidimicrobiales bacterium]|nr:FAD-binding oxidoreductase [Acidimicrobiales bacterium]
MIAPLAADFTEGVLWQDQAPADPDPEPAAPLPPQVDALVVGAGYAGVSAARELAAAGREVLVVDAHPVGWGASTRNGGMVIPELKAGPAALGEALGPLGPRLYAEVNEAFDHVESLVAGPDPEIACDYERTGQLYLAHAARLVPALREIAREHGDELGEPVRFVERDALAAEVGSRAYHGGVVFERTGGLHPARFHRGLVARARQAGARVVGDVRVSGVGRTGSRPGFLVATTAGEVAAADVVVCTNAYADAAVPALARRVLPVGSFIIATEVLHPGLARAVIPKRRMLVDTKNFLYYWRLTPDGRMLFGGRRSLARTSVAAARDFLHRSMVRVHPQLDGVRVARAWGGDVAVTLDRLPHVGTVGGAWYVTGCNGSGVALNTWLGMRVGRHLVGDGPAPGFAQLPHRPIPLHRLRRAYLPAVGLWFRWQDRGFRP